MQLLLSCLLASWAYTAFALDWDNDNQDPLLWIKAQLPAQNAQVPKVPEPKTVPNPMAQAHVAYDSGDYKRVLEIVRPLADKGNADAQNFLGTLYLEGRGVTKDYAEALKWLRKAEAQGNRGAQSNLGVMYQRGWGVPKDEPEAFRLFQKAALQGHPVGQYNLGISFMKGIGTTQNYVEAAKWLRKSAQQGFPNAQANLARLYLLGNGVAKDSDQALKWASKAAEKNHANAQRLLGDILYGDKNFAEAVKWYRKAAEQGDNMSQFLLGFIYSGGSDGKAFQGVPIDNVEAYKWFLLAMDDENNILARNHALLVDTKLTAEQLAEARKRADQIREKLPKK